MRSKILLFIIIIGILLITNDKCFGKENKYNFLLVDEIVYDKNYANVEIISESISILIDKNNFKVKVGKEEIKIEDEYKKHSYSNNELYILTKNRLYLINLELLSYNFFDINIDCNDILVNEYVYLVGSLENKPTIKILNKNCEEQKIKNYEGSGFGTFTNIFLKEDNLYLIGIKDAHFSNDIFLNVGNQKDKKSFILSVDKTLKEKNIYHFNENRPYEEIVSYKVGESIDIILKSSKKSYYYSFNSNLELLDYLLVDENDNVIHLINSLKSKLFVFSNDKTTILKLLEENSFTNVFNIDKKLVNHKVMNGGLYLTFKEDVTKTIIYSEYHILKKEELFLSKLSYNLDEKKHFLVDSFFENLTFDIYEIKPFHQYMLSGEYEVTYISINKLGKEIYITTPLKVLDYTNIISGGIYNLNTKLMFFGNAYLDGKSINNGFVLKDEGYHELTLKDINGTEKKYNFYVVADYYKNNDNIKLPYDYIFEYGEYFEVEFEILKNKKVEKIFINDEEFSNYKQVDNKIRLFFSLDNWGYKEFVINKIIFDDEEIIILDKKYTLLMRKRKPEFNISINNEQGYLFHVDVNDPDLTIIDVVFKKEKETNTFLKNGSYNISNCICYIKYELGDGNIYEQEIFSYVGDSTICNLEVNYDESIKNINLLLDTNKNTKQIKVNNENIYKKEEGNKNHIIMLVTIVSSIIILITTFIILIARKKKGDKLIKLK